MVVHIGYLTLWFHTVYLRLFLVKGPGTFVPSAAMKVLTQYNWVEKTICKHLCWHPFFFFRVIIIFFFWGFQMLEKPVGVFNCLAFIWNRPQSQNFKAKPIMLRSKVAPPFQRDKYQPMSWQSNCWNVIIPQQTRGNCRHLSYQKLSSGSSSSRPTLAGRVRCHPTSGAQQLRDPSSRVPARVQIGP